MLTFAKAGALANIWIRRADPLYHLDDGLAKALQAEIAQNSTANGESALSLTLAKLEAVARQCADAQVCLSRPGVQNRLISARADRLRGK